jgi:hypothetical protein
MASIIGLLSLFPVFFWIFFSFMVIRLIVTWFKYR